MQKIILYYQFRPIADPEAIKLWQRTLGEKLQLKGRVLISPHGINGTLGGDTDDLKTYVKETKSYFKNTTFKWSDGSRDDFPKLSVKVRPEIVSFGAADEIKVDERGIVGGGQRLSPKAVHKLVKARGQDVVFFDGRNAYEAGVGKFKDAVVPRVKHTRDFVKELDDSKYEAIKNKPVVTYCTGGIRCEVLSVLMKNRGFQEVYQMDGGIVKYGEEYGDTGLWEGSLYVFDGRMGTKFTDDASDIGACTHCGNNTSNYVNCVNKTCNSLTLICTNCQKERIISCQNCTKERTSARLQT